MTYLATPFRLAVALTMLGLLSACEDYTSPRAAIETAASALQGGDAALLARALEGSARDQYANPVGMAQLQGLLREQSPRIEEPRLTASARGAGGWDEQETYEARVSGRDGPLLEVVVHCLVNDPIVPALEEMGEDIARLKPSAPSPHFRRECHIQELRKS